MLEPISQKILIRNKTECFLPFFHAPPLSHAPPPKHFDVHLRLRNIDPRGIKQATARQGAVAVLHQLRAEQDKTCLGGAKTCGMGH